MIEKLKEEIENCLSDYSFEFEYNEVASYFDNDDTAYEVTIKYKRSNKEFTIHVEEDVEPIKGLSFEICEDCWEEITETNLFKYMFFELL